MDNFFGALILKFPYGLTRVCREKKLLTLIKFWYLLKAQNSLGFFRKGDISGLELNCSQSQLWSKFKKLVNLGLIRKGKNGYYLVSYDSLWKYLGYTYSFVKSKETHERRNNFRILKYESSELDYVWEELDRLLIQDSFKKQEKAIAIESTTMPKFEVEYVNGFLNHVYTVNIDGSIVDRASCALNFFRKDEKNLDISLSCNGVASVLGYRSSQSGHKYQHQFYNPINRCIKIQSEWNDLLGRDSAKQLVKTFHKPFFHDKQSGGIYLRISNIF